MALNPLFGVFIDPNAATPQEPFRLAKIADEGGLDLLTMQDHPYQGQFFDTWTLMTALAMHTTRIHLGQNVGNLPLRLPTIIAKQTASLDILTGGRVELGLGAGGFWDAVAAYGGPRRTPGEAFAAYEDALHIVRGMWENTGRAFSYRGKVYSVSGAQPGPAPAHRIPIWAGAMRPRMFRLIGRLADGVFISMPYLPPENLPQVNALIDEGAQRAGRHPDEIRRGYNLKGLIRPGQGSQSYSTQRGLIVGTAGYWAEQILLFYHKYKQDTFIFSGGGEMASQLEIFTQEVVPQVKQQLAQSA